MKKVSHVGLIIKVEYGSGNYIIFKVIGYNPKINNYLTKTIKIVGKPLPILINIFHKKEPMYRKNSILGVKISNMILDKVNYKNGENYSIKIDTIKPKIDKLLEL